MRRRRWIWIPISISLFLIAATIAIGNAIIENRPKPYITVNGEEVYEGEMMIYYRLMQLEFEKAGGEEIWDLNMLGFDSKQAVIDRAFASVIRIKVAQSIAGTIKSQEYTEILKRSDQLEDILGKDFMEEHGIDRELIEKVVSENYLIHRYEETAGFRTSDFEEQIQALVEERYGLYDELDKEDYLQNVTLIPMMFYTGEYAEGEWISYPESQKEQIRQTAMEIYELVDEKNFYAMTLRFGNNRGDVQLNPVFHQGDIISPGGNMGNVYKGQILPEAAEVIFDTEPGTMTEFMTTEYGYLVCLVTRITGPYEQDLITYQNQLQIVRSSFREQAFGVLKQQRLEEEWNRLEQESEITVRKEAFSELVEYGQK